MVSTHGLILLENLCRRMRAMVVRTIMVVHMVTPPRTSCLWDRRWFLEHRDLSSHRKAWMVKGRVCGETSLTIPVFPPGSHSWLGRLAQRISWDQGGGGGWLSLVGLGGKQSMLCVSILKTTHLVTVPSTRQATSTPTLFLFFSSRKGCILWEGLLKLALSGTSQHGFTARINTLIIKLQCIWVKLIHCWPRAQVEFPCYEKKEHSGINGTVSAEPITLSTADSSRK